MTALIEKLNVVGQGYIDQSFRLNQKEPLLWTISGKNLSVAINNRKNIGQEIKVLKWMDKIWIYIEISFIFNTQTRKIRSKSNVVIPNIFLSLSIFQGTHEDEVKTQLFRAEWDNYDELSDHHPQPHWHFHSYKYPIEIPDNFKELIEVTELNDSFKEFITQGTDLIDIKKFHFAMNGQWAEKKSDVHKIKMEEDLINWFSGILNHIKKELIYLIEK